MHHFTANELADAWELRSGLIGATAWGRAAAVAACLRECAAELRHAAAPQPEAQPQWQPIETAPSDVIVVVAWFESDGTPHYDFDHKEDDCWQRWHDNAEHVEIIGGHGVSYTPPYECWMPLPAAPSAQAEPSDTQRCIAARNQLNKALYGGGAVIDSLERAVANACAKLAAQSHVRAAALEEAAALCETWNTTPGHLLANEVRNLKAAQAEQGGK